MELITLIFFTVVLVILATKFLPYVYEACMFRIVLNKIPGPGIPLFGLAILNMTKDKAEMNKNILSYGQQFPKGIFRVWMLFKAEVHLFNPHYMEALLQSTKEIKKSHFYDFLLPWLGDGLLTSTGAKWFRDRKLITPTFHFNILQNLALNMIEKSEIMTMCLEKRLKMDPTKPIEVHSLVAKCTLDTLCETSMGISVDAQGEDDGETEYHKALYNFIDMLFHRFFRPWLSLECIFKHTKEGKEMFASIKMLKDFGEKIIRQKQEIRKLNKSGDNHNENDNNIDELGRPKKKAFLDHLLDASEKEKNPLSVEEIREQVDSFIFAGHDTTASAISWTLFCLGNELEVQKKLHDELKAVFGDDKRSATVSDLTELKYLDRVLKEVMRLYPPVPVFSRTLLNSTEIAGYTLPKGASISFNTLLTHRNPMFWPNPDKFDPDRFLPENLIGRHPFAYIPFSAGPRNCIGQKFAQLEMKFIMTAILRRWSVKSVQTFEDIGAYQALVLRATNGVYIEFTPKD
ncbi:cytochrome P450 4C1-like [Prorops nasuta]|uniref:cytochrome P450 4C1-like n=1 Tax=Prorops nasuta TaxID=863751 RepID=UPI0034CDEBFA